MTTLTRAREILDTIKIVAIGDDIVLPEEQWIQVGQPVISCECVVVGVINQTPSIAADQAVNAAGQMCAPTISASFIAAIVREGDPSHHDGSNYIHGLNEMSEAAERDGEILWEAITSAIPPSMVPTTGVVMNFEIEGNLISTSVTFSTGI